MWREAYDHEGDAIIISAVGARCGKCFKASGEWSAIANTHVVWPIAEVVDRNFLWFKINDENFWVKGGSAQPFVKTRDSFKYEFSLPPLPEQQRIVEKIETLFAQIDKGEEAVREVQKLLTRYRQSVLKSAVTGQLTADWRSEHEGELADGEELLLQILEQRRATWNAKGKYKAPEEPGAAPLQELPAGWGWASVDQVTSHFGNGLSRKPVLEFTEFPILRISAARPMKISVDDFRYYAPNEGENIDRFWVESGDLLFTRYNGSTHLVGVCGLMREEGRVLHPDKLIKARPVASPDLSAEYLELAWNCGETRKHIERNIKTTAGQQGIAGSDVKTAPFPLPSGAEQAEIAAQVQEAFAKAESLEDWCETALKRSASLRQSILKDAFAGRLVPQDLSDEPASTLLARITEAKTPTKKKRRKAQA